MQEPFLLSIHISSPYLSPQHSFHNQLTQKAAQRQTKQPPKQLAQGDKGCSEKPSTFSSLSISLSAIHIDVEHLATFKKGKGPAERGAPTYISPPLFFIFFSPPTLVHTWRAFIFLSFRSPPTEVPQRTILCQQPRRRTTLSLSLSHCYLPQQPPSLPSPIRCHNPQQPPDFIHHPS